MNSQEQDRTYAETMLLFLKCFCRTRQVLVHLAFDSLQRLEQFASTGVEFFAFAFNRLVVFEVVYRFGYFFPSPIDEE